jgi:phosphoribosylanthranilate isomerase
VTRVKICGVNSVEGFDAACAAGADWVGFVYWEKSPRAVTPWLAAGLSARMEGGPKRVGLFVEPNDSDIAAALAALPLDVLQLYADEARVADVAGKFGVPVWRSCAVAGGADLPRGAGAASALVVEARAPAGGARPGGNGVALDWGVLRGWRPGFEWILAAGGGRRARAGRRAAGVTAGNVAEAVRVSGASAVDVSSGVERRVGEKDAGLIRAFVQVARSVDC